MSGTVLGPARWRIVGSGLAAVAERDALGTTARLAIWPASSLRAAVGAVDRELHRLDLAASRFRADSEVSGLHAHDGRPVEISAGLAEAISVALAAAEWSGGLVDPTVGAAMIALGYDRDFVQVRARRGDHRPLSPAAAPGWAAVQLDGLRVQVPRGVLLDLGATAKGLGADWSARAAALAAGGTGGVLVSLGGDVAAAGDSPQGGWPVLVADDHRQSVRSTSRRSPTQLARLARGGLATSSTACREWRRAGRTLHHIVDPRTGLPAAGPWRTASAVASTCAEANAASTAAIILGADAPAWLAERGIPARLVARDGAVVHVGGWPRNDDGQLAPPGRRLLQVPRFPRPAAAPGARR